MVWSENVETGEVELKPVTEVFEREDNVLVHLTVNDETINTTALHPFYIVDKGWTEAIEINVGDEVLLHDGSTAFVDNKEVEALSNSVKVYNFTVDDNHTYFVGFNGLLTHNQCERHHIASDKSKKTGYTAKYKEIFDKGDVKFNDEHNIIVLEDHRGRHTNNYKDKVLKALSDGINELENLTSGTPSKEEYRNRIYEVLGGLKEILRQNKRFPYE